MRWVLIIFIAAGSRSTPTMTSVDMATEEACWAAGTKAVETFIKSGGTFTRGDFVCVRKS